jgi:SAM-dependent methyltransferase
MRSKLNLGCGYDHRPIGWINADVDERIFPDLTVGGYQQLDDSGTEEMLLIRGNDAPDFYGSYLPIGQGELKQVMACHIFEHVDKANVVSLLREIRRVLAPGGQLLIVCPDIDTIIRHFVTLDGSRLGGNAKFSDNPSPWGSTPDERWTGDTAVELLREAVLEDDPDDRRLPTSEHQWNTYGSRLSDITRKVFPDTVLLGVAGPPQKIVEQSFDANTTNFGKCRVTWVDPDSGYEWPTAGWHNFSCAVLATAS